MWGWLSSPEVAVYLHSNARATVREGPGRRRPVSPEGLETLSDSSLVSPLVSEHASSYFYKCLVEADIVVLSFITHILRT